jgi:hypothetical protein
MVERFDRYEAMVEEGLLGVLKRLGLSKNISQFMDPGARANQGAATIKSRLCSIGGFDPDEWDLPPKPCINRAWTCDA